MDHPQTPPMVSVVCSDALLDGGNRRCIYTSPLHVLGETLSRHKEEAAEKSNWSRGDLGYWDKKTEIS
ncbi:hypothetical protein Y1Q_0022013 [Alligator mississippiensis]|uniref:Uncharacterized protein n=1 Tax=Alligator mississippiensis TaxID=8496 RepID=A0A151NLM0_ALLMI|nr:hypothetical protein Y1Q_0022013 [Alligator mississippiensis]